MSVLRPFLQTHPQSPHRDITRRTLKNWRGHQYGTMAAPQRTTRGPIRRFTRAGDGKCSVSIWFLLLSNLLVFQMTYFRDTLWSNTPNLDMILNKPAQKDGSSYILDFPRGSAVALPSIQVSKAENEEINRKHCECGTCSLMHVTTVVLYLYATVCISKLWHRGIRAQL